MRREATKDAAKSRTRHNYDELYEEVDSKEGENTLYRRIHQAGKDVQHARKMKDTYGKVMIEA